MSHINRKFIAEGIKRYDNQAYEKDKQLERVIQDKLKRLFPRGEVRYITKDILIDILTWKAPRIKGWGNKNSEDFVIEVTKNCFASKNEQFKIEGLTILKGVKYRAASTILHFCFPDEYTVMDWRAWKTLKLNNQLREGLKDDFRHWQLYLGICKRLSKKYGCSLRDLDKALWANCE